MYTDELDIFFNEVATVLHSGELLVQKQKVSLADKFSRWLFEKEIQELQYQIDIIVEISRLKKIKKDSSFSIDRRYRLLHERQEGKIGKDVVRMLTQHILCKDDYISRNVCKEAFKRKKIIDSTLIWVGKKSANLIEDKLASILKHDTMQIFANIFAKELDAKLCVSFELITYLEQLGCESLYIRKDINDYLRDLASIFANFNIDIIEYLQKYKDFDPEFGCYEDYRDETFAGKKNDENYELKFEDYLIHKNKKHLMEVLHGLVDGKECKDVTKVLIALEEVSFLQRPSNAKLYRSLLNEFALDFSESPSAMNTFFREKNTKYTNEEIRIVINSLLEIK